MAPEIKHTGQGQGPVTQKLPPDPAAGQWHLDKRVPLALVVTLVAQSALAVWFFADMARQVENLREMAAIVPRVVNTLERLDERMAQTERRITEANADAIEARRERFDLSRSVAVLNNQVTSLTEAISALNDTLRANADDLRQLQNGPNR